MIILSNLEAKLYNIFLEPFLKNLKLKVAQIVGRYELNPVIDICCGTGAQVNYLQAGGRRSFGVDLNSGMIRYATTKYKSPRFLVADARRLPLKDNYFGAAILSFALHEKPEKERKSIINEALRSLKPDGLIFIVDFENPWDKKSSAGALLRNFIERLAGKEHYRFGQDFLKKGGLSALLKRLGLVTIERYHFPWAATVLVVVRRLNQS